MLCLNENATSYEREKFMQIRIFCVHCTSRFRCRYFCLKANFFRNKMAGRVNTYLWTSSCGSTWCDKQRPYIERWAGNWTVAHPNDFCHQSIFLSAIPSNQRRSFDYFHTINGNNHNWAFGWNRRKSRKISPKQKTSNNSIYQLTILNQVCMTRHFLEKSIVWLNSLKILKEQSICAAQNKCSISIWRRCLALFCLILYENSEKKTFLNKLLKATSDFALQNHMKFPKMSKIRFSFPKLTRSNSSYLFCMTR